MKTPREATRVLLALLTWQLLLPLAASAYSVKVRWGASADPTIAGYHLYVRESGTDYGPPRTVEPAALDADGGLTTVLGDLAIEQTYTFALSAFTADGRESARSNERTIGYAQAAWVIDSDGDGLVDAEEDTNLNGIRDPGETDRLVADTDGDLIPDGIERERGSDPLVADSVCDPLPFADFAFSKRGVADVGYDTAVDDTVLQATALSPSPLQFRGSYPAHGAASFSAPVLVTAIRSGTRFRIEIAVRSTIGKRYTLQYEGNGGVDRLSRHNLTLTLGDRYSSDEYQPFARDLAADLRVIDPNAVLAMVTHVRVRGQYVMRELRLCA